MKFATIAEILRWRSHTEPDRLAFTFLVDGELDRAVHVSYGELGDRARRIAQYISDNVGSGQAGKPVLLVLPPGLEVIETIFACFYAGVVAVVADFPRRRSSVAMLEGIIEDSGAAIAITADASQLQSALAGSDALANLRWLALNDMPQDQVASSLAGSVSPDAIALLQYTSGSTSTPKGVMISHSNIMHNAASIQQRFALGENSRTVFWLPPSHDMGLVGGIFQPLYSGFNGVLMPPLAFIQRPVRWLNAISSLHATTSAAPNFAWDLCVRKISPEQRDSLNLSAWSVGINGAEAVHSLTIDRFSDYFAPCGFRREAFCPAYGLAEATLVVSGEKRQTPPRVQPAPGHDSGRAQLIVGCGKLLDDQKLVIVDPQLAVSQPPGTVGEIWLNSGSVARGYWNRPEETDSVFRAWLSDSGEGPFLRTGDLGYISDGDLFITGRLKDVIIVRGANYSPFAIERTVERSHAALQPSGGAAFTIDTESGERLVVVHEVERSFIRTLPEKEVFHAIRQALADEHGLEAHSIALLRTAALPRTVTGKAKRYACRQGFLDGSLSTIAQWTMDSSAGPTPRNTPVAASPLAVSGHEQEIRVWLIRRLADQLSVAESEIEIRRPFAEYGFDSARVVELAGDLEDYLGCELSPTCVYDYSTIESLCAYLAKVSAAARVTTRAAGG